MKLYNRYGCEIEFEALDASKEVDMSIENTNGHATYQINKEDAIKIIAHLQQEFTL